MSARIIEHLNSQGLDIARKSSRPKLHSNPIHPGMLSRTRPGFDVERGGPSNGTPPDASSPNVTDPTRQNKSFPVPLPTHGAEASSNHQRGTYDPALANAVMDEATRSPDDYAKSLHTALPTTVAEK